MKFGYSRKLPKGLRPGRSPLVTQLFSKPEGEKHDWIFFDDREWSETYTEQLTQCPACEQRLERENLGRMTYQA